MKEWWKQNSNLPVKDSMETEILGSTEDEIPGSTDDEVESSAECQIKLYTKAEVEDFTGCIPLLLDKCATKGKIDLGFSDFYDIIDKAQNFVKTMKKSPDSAWKEYVELCSASRTQLTSLGIATT